MIVACECVNVFFGRKKKKKILPVERSDVASYFMFTFFSSRWRAIQKQQHPDDQYNVVAAYVRVYLPKKDEV